MGLHTAEPEPQKRLRSFAGLRTSGRSKDRPKTGRGLVTTLTTFPSLSPKELRYQRRETFRCLPHIGKNPPKCGKTRRLGRVDLVKSGNSAWFKGLVYCAQVWACPVCAYRVAGYRSQELQKIIEAHRKTGGGIYLVTCTLPHDEGDELKKLRESVSRAWSKIISGKEWLKMKIRIGYVGYVRALEVTKGPNGWHPHLHVLIFTEKAFLIDLLEDFLFQRWSLQVVKLGYRRPRREYGVKLSAGEDAGYYITKIVKQGLASEAAGGAGKNARSASRSVNEILDDYRSQKRESDKKLLVAWIKSMYGARQLTWGGMIRSRFRDLPLLTDAEVVQEEEAAGHSILCFSAEHWDSYLKNEPGVRWQLISALERAGPEEALDLIRKLLPEREFDRFLALQRFLNA